MIDLEAVLPILLYISLIVLVIFSITFIIRLIKVLNKVDTILDDCSRKLIKLDGLFELIDHTTDYAANLSDKIVTSVANCVNFIFRRKKGRNEDE